MFVNLDTHILISFCVYSSVTKAIDNHLYKIRELGYVFSF